MEFSQLSGIICKLRVLRLRAGWCDELQYTEEEKKGIDKVERMNRLFDKVVLPGIGVLVILLLISFIAGKFREKFTRDDPGTTASSAPREETDVFGRRKELLRGYEQHKDAFAAYGYEPVEGYAYALSLGKTVDEEMTIFQFSDEALGELSIVNYMPKGKKAPYRSLSLAVSSPTMLVVTVKKEDEKHVVTFTDTGFSHYQPEDQDAYQSLMKLTTQEDLQAMYDIFTTDLDHLQSACEQ